MELVLLSSIACFLIGAFLSADITLRATRKPARTFTVYDVPRRKLDKIAKAQNGWRIMRLVNGTHVGTYDIVFCSG